MFGRTSDARKRSLQLWNPFARSSERQTYTPKPCEVFSSLRQYMLDMWVYFVFFPSGYIGFAIQVREENLKSSVFSFVIGTGLDMRRMCCSSVC